MDDLKRLDRLIEEEEDRIDNAAADAALAEPGFKRFEVIHLAGASSAAVAYQ